MSDCEHPRGSYVNPAQALEFLYPQVEVLSGGEKARLALAKFMLSAGSLLVLDEPTNHLDIPSKEMLEEALQRFEGSVIAVSHDRYFLRRIATRVVTVRWKCTNKGGVVCFVRGQLQPIRIPSN